MYSSFTLFLIVRVIVAMELLIILVSLTVILWSFTVTVQVYVFFCPYR